MTTRRDQLKKEAQEAETEYHKNTKAQRTIKRLRAAEKRRQHEEYDDY